MCRPFFGKYDDFRDYEYPFGADFLQSVFPEGSYKKKFSMSGDGIYDLVFIDNKIYDIKMKKGAEMLINDNKKAFRDETKDKVIQIIAEALTNRNIEFSINSGKFITFKYYKYIFKVEVIKKAAIPE